MPDDVTSPTLPENLMPEPGIDGVGVAEPITYAVEHLHAAGVAYATGHGPFGAARRIVDTAGSGRFDGMFRASLGHAIWFHRPPRTDDRVLYDIEAVTHRDDRILTSGRIVDGGGRRVATVAQEILARAPAAG